MAETNTNNFNKEIDCATFVSGDQQFHFHLTTPESVKEFLPIFLKLISGKVGRDKKAGNLTFELDSQKLVLDSKIVQQRLAASRNIEGYLSSRLVLHQFRRWAVEYVPLEARVDVMAPVDSEIQLELIEEIPPEYHEGEAAPQQLQQKKIADITTAVQVYQAFVILGAPGCGKTSTLEKIVYNSALETLNNSSQGKIPLFVRLSQQKNRQPFDFLKTEWDQVIQENFADALAKGKVQILADGINELARNSRREQLVDWRYFAQKAVDQGNQVIFSSRELDYEPLLNLPRVKVEALDDERILDYLKKHQVEALVDEMEINRPLTELARNPYYLSILTAVFHISKKVISNRGLLMHQFVSNLLKRERNNNHPDCMEDEIVISALGQMAFVLQGEGENLVFDLAKARAALPARVTCHKQEIVVDADALLRLGRAATLLDPVVDPDVRFYHQLLQEYFAANELLIRFKAGEDLSRLWQAPTLQDEMPPAEVGEWDPLPAPPNTGWEVTTILACGICPDPAKLIQAVRVVNPALAGRCLYEAGLVDKPENELKETRQVLLKQLYSSKIHLRARLLAGEVLGRIGDPRFEVQEMNGIKVILPQMVNVPAGKYWIGSQADDPQAYGNEKPCFNVTLTAFKIGRWQVTNAEFACFMAAGGYQDECWWQGDLAKRWLNGEDVTGGLNKSVLDFWDLLKKTPDWQERVKNNWSPENIKNWEVFINMEKEEFVQLTSRQIQTKSRRQPAFWTRSGWDNPSQPVTGITWFEANAYAVWLSTASKEIFRLPNETEWEAAARGVEGWIYPWGNEWDDDKANSIESRVMKPSPVGAYAATGGLGPFGAEDQAGNVYEWARSLYKPYPAQLFNEADQESTVERVARGGSWRDSRRGVRGAGRRRSIPDYFSDSIGFRLLSPRSVA